MHENVRIEIDRDFRISSISATRSEHDHHLVSTGLVDLQMNGYDDVDVADASHAALAHLVEKLRFAGTFHFLATLVSAPKSDMLRRAQQLARFVQSDPSNALVGIHLEGPFLGGAHGAHSSRDIVDADAEWIASLPDEVRLMTIAPDNPSCVQAIRALRERGILVSLGHGEPTRQQFNDAVIAGASSVTHLFNAMSGVHHREGGMALWSIVENQLDTGIIADGVHVSDETGVLIDRAIDPSRRFLVSDSIAWNGLWAQKRQIEVRDGVPRLPSGTLAGSAATLAECVANAVHRWNWPLDVALRSATSIPSRMIGLTPPRVTIGGPAHLVCWNYDLRVERVVGGRTPETL